MKTTYTDKQFREAVAANYSIASTLRSLGLKPCGQAYNLFKLRVSKLGIDTSHFTGQGHLKGKTHSWNKIIPIEQILVEHSTYSNGVHLKERLVKENLLDQNQCAICNMEPIWQDKPLCFHLDHINGHHDDNRIENLRLLCPNCHTQCPTYAGRNIETKSTKGHNVKPCDDCSRLIPSRYKRCRECNNILRAQQKAQRLKVCIDCSKQIQPKNTRCRECDIEHRRIIKLDKNTKIIWPPIEELLVMVENTPFTTIAKQLGVSDSAIRKHIKTHLK